MNICSRLLRVVVLLGGLLTLGTAHGVPVRLIDGLESITFYERSGADAPTPFTFAIVGPQLTVRLADPLGGNANFDFQGVTSEYYDVYYSDAGGTFNLDGEYLSIEGVFLFGLPNGGGLNLAEIALNFADDVLEFGNFVASFVALGDNGNGATASLAIDGDLQTHTTMGNTIDSSQRLRVTLGFSSSSGPPPTPVPEPASLLLLAWGLLGMRLALRRPAC